MVLLLQLGGILVAGSIAAIAWTSSKPAPEAVARTIVILALAFAYLAFWGNLWQTGKGLLSQRDSWEALTPAHAALAGKPVGVRGPFAEWIRGRLGPGQSFYIVEKPALDESVYQWFTFRLMPNLATNRPERADWLIFYGTSAKASGYLERISGAAEQYAPGYSIARVRHAS